MPFNTVEPISCQRQNVLLYFEKGMMGVLTKDDTLQLRRIKFLEPPPAFEGSYVLSRDELHNNQLYTVLLIQSHKGLAVFITPVTSLSQNVNRLYSIILSSDPCNNGTTKQTNR